MCSFNSWKCSWSNDSLTDNNNWYALILLAVWLNVDYIVFIRSTKAWFVCVLLFRHEIYSNMSCIKRPLNLRTLKSLYLEKYKMVQIINFSSVHTVIHSRQDLFKRLIFESHSVCTQFSIVQVHCSQLDWFKFWETWVIMIFQMKPLATNQQLLTWFCVHQSPQIIRRRHFIFYSLYFFYQSK